MFRLIESSSGKLLKHVLGTSSKSAHFWDPKKFIWRNIRGEGDVWDLYVTIFGNHFLIKTQLITVNVSTALQDLGP